MEAEARQPPLDSGRTRHGLTRNIEHAGEQKCPKPQQGEADTKAGQIPLETVRTGQGLARATVDAGEPEDSKTAEAARCLVGELETGRREPSPFSQGKL
jgi:hypothetical protein